MALLEIQYFARGMVKKVKKYRNQVVKQKEQSKLKRQNMLM